MKDITELVKFLVNELVDDKESVKVELDGETINVSVAQPDMGRVIGKQGRIAKAIRTIVKAAGAKDNKRYVVEILDN